MAQRDGSQVFGLIDVVFLRNLKAFFFFSFLRLRLSDAGPQGPPETASKAILVEVSPVAKCASSPSVQDVQDDQVQDVVQSA